MRAESPDFYRNRKVTRREALVLLVGGTLAAATCGPRIKNSASNRFLPTNPEVRNRLSTQVEAGVVAIYEGVNIRTAPVIPSKTRFRQPDNRIDWGQIETVNGVELNDKSAFMVVNPRVVVGQNTTDSTRDGFDWIKLNIKKKGEESVKPYYVNHSVNTGNLVRRLGYAGYIATPDGQTARLGIYKFESDLLDAEDIDRVIVPENLETLAGDIMPKLWSERLRNQFDGLAPADGRFVMNVPVVDTTGENPRLETGQELPRINVREYPSLKYGNGEDVKVIGTIPQATILEKVLVPPDDLYHFDFAAVLSEDLDGVLVDADGKFVEPVQDQVYAIALPYLLVL